MSHVIPTTEPKDLRVGDTWTWKLALADYPAPTWNLVYAFQDAGGHKFTTTSADDGADHLITVAAATTAGYLFGWYQWQCRVTDGSALYTIRRGRVFLWPDLTSASMDGRSTSRQIADALAALVLGKAGAGDLQGYTIGGMSVNRLSPRELQDWAARYAALADMEDAQALAENEGTAGGIILAEFYQP